MKHFFKALFLFACFASCKTLIKTSEPTNDQYPGVDYVKVGELTGLYDDPYVFNLRNNQKELVFIGTEHTNDPKHKQFKIIETYFSHAVPEIVFHEGGPLLDTTHLKTSEEAIMHHQETGYLKFLCKNWGIQMENADLTAREEFRLMLQKYSQEELFLYYTVERLIYPFQHGFEGKLTLQEAYSNFINNYLSKHSFPITTEQKDFNYFEKLYKKHIGTSFNLATYDYSKFNFLVDNGRFSQIGRASKVVRDNALLAKIDEALNRYDRVFVIFGSAHALAVEPALVKIIKNKH